MHFCLRYFCWLLLSMISYNTLFCTAGSSDIPANGQHQPGSEASADDGLVEQRLSDVGESADPQLILPFILPTQFIANDGRKVAIPPNLPNDFDKNVVDKLKSLIALEKIHNKLDSLEHIPPQMFLLESNVAVTPQILQQITAGANAVAKAVASAHTGNAAGSSTRVADRKSQSSAVASYITAKADELVSKRSIAKRKFNTRGGPPLVQVLSLQKYMTSAITSKTDEKDASTTKPVSPSSRNRNTQLNKAPYLLQPIASNSKSQILSEAELISPAVPQRAQQQQTVTVVRERHDDATDFFQNHDVPRESHKVLNPPANRHHSTSSSPRVPPSDEALISSAFAQQPQQQQQAQQQQTVTVVREHYEDANDFFQNKNNMPAESHNVLSTPVNEPSEPYSLPYSPRPDQSNAASPSFAQQAQPAVTVVREHYDDVKDFFQTPDIIPGESHKILSTSVNGPSEPYSTSNSPDSIQSKVALISPAFASQTQQQQPATVVREHYEDAKDFFQNHDIVPAGHKGLFTSISGPSEPYSTPSTSAEHYSSIIDESVPNAAVGVESAVSQDQNVQSPDAVRNADWVADGAVRDRVEADRNDFLNGKRGILFDEVAPDSSSSSHPSGRLSSTSAAFIHRTQLKANQANAVSSSTLKQRRHSPLSEENLTFDDMVSKPEEVYYGGSEKYSEKSKSAGLQRGKYEPFHELPLPSSSKSSLALEINTTYVDQNDAGLPHRPITYPNLAVPTTQHFDTESLVELDQWPEESVKSVLPLHHKQGGSSKRWTSSTKAKPLAATVDSGQVAVKNQADTNWTTVVASNNTEVDATLLLFEAINATTTDCLAVNNHTSNDMLTNGTNSKNTSCEQFLDWLTDDHQLHGGKNGSEGNATAVTRLVLGNATAERSLNSTHFSSSLNTTSTGGKMSSNFAARTSTSLVHGGSETTISHSDNVLNTTTTAIVNATYDNKKSIDTTTTRSVTPPTSSKASVKTAVAEITS